MAAFVTSFAPLLKRHHHTQSKRTLNSTHPQAPLRRKHAPLRMTINPNQSELTYASSGVNIDTEAESVKSLISALRTKRAARQPGEEGALVPHPGGFSGLIEFGDRLLALCTDGVGSKLLLASELQTYETIAQDCVAMNVNDLVCIGAEPLAFVDYIAAPKPEPVIWAALGRSLATACSLARVSLCGGETASLPDMVSHIDMSGTALGSLPRGAQIDGSVIVPGDVVIGLPSSGIHSNGFSLVRRVLERTGVSMHDVAPFDVMVGQRADPIARFAGREAQPVTMGEVLLMPTRIYVDPIIDLLKSGREDAIPCAYTDIHGIVHVTGGGLSNLLRLNGNVGFEIEDALPVLPEFEWLQSAANISDYEMWRTFNMGMGMCLIVNAASAPAICTWLNERLPGCRPVGRVTSHAGVVRHLQTDVLYDRY